MSNLDHPARVLRTWVPPTVLRCALKASGCFQGVDGHKGLKAVAHERLEPLPDHPPRVGTLKRGGTLRQNIP